MRMGPYWLLRCFNPRTHTGCDADNLQDLWLKKVSIHAPTRGATSAGKLGGSFGWFQSTHPHGVRLFDLSKSTKKAVVSIHAPTRGATQVRFYTFRGQKFQSTHPHGVRLPVLLGLPIVSLFQSTHPHGVRLNACQKAIHQFIVSIHAPTRGATSSS